MPETNNPTPETAPAADLLVAEARAAVHESLIFLAAPEADRVRALIADLETAVEGRTAIRFAAAAVPAPAPTDFELRGTGEIRAAALTEAADFLRDAHFREGLSVQEVGTAMRHWADRERADAASGPGGVAGETQQPETQAFTVQVWPLTRVLAETRCGSQDWTWDEEWADLDRRHAESGYLGRLEQDIRTNGITMPVLIGTDGRIWDGHHRLRVAVRLGIGYVPVEVPAAVSQPDGEA